MYSVIIMLETNSTRNAWDNWSLLTIIVAILGAAGGILVAATLKYADAILKTLATAGSIVISTLLGYFFLGGPLNVVIVIGACAVILAIFNYTMDTSAPQPTIQVSTSKISSSDDLELATALLPEKDLKDGSSSHGFAESRRTRKSSSKDESE
jgi:hypothetical protein